MFDSHDFKYTYGNSGKMYRDYNKVIDELESIELDEVFVGSKMNAVKVIDVDEMNQHSSYGSNDFADCSDCSDWTDVNDSIPDQTDTEIPFSRSNSFNQRCPTGHPGPVGSEPSAISTPSKPKPGPRTLIHDDDDNQGLTGPFMAKLVDAPKKIKNAVSDLVDRLNSTLNDSKSNSKPKNIRKLRTKGKGQNHNQYKRKRKHHGHGHGHSTAKIVHIHHYHSGFQPSAYGYYDQNQIQNPVGLTY